MAQAYIGELPEGTKRCQICAEPINVNAQKCIHCQSDQGGWRRRLGLSTSVLALLVALVSVLTWAIPLIKDGLTPKNSNLTFSFQGGDGNFLGALVSNQGARPGSVTKAELRYQGYTVFLEQLGIGPIVNVVPPGTSMLLSFRRTGTGSSRSAGDGTCQLLFGTTDFTGRSSIKSTDVDCPLVQAFAGNW
jgi:hypothetical protein